MPAEQGSQEASRLDGLLSTSALAKGDILLQLLRDRTLLQIFPGTIAKPHFSPLEQIWELERQFTEKPKPRTMHSCWQRRLRNGPKRIHSPIWPRPGGRLKIGQRPPPELPPHWRKAEKNHEFHFARLFPVMNPRERALFIWSAARGFFPIEQPAALDRTGSL